MSTINKIILVALCCLSQNALAEALSFKANSSSHPVALVELYTSQGCSSCPPADKWLSSLEASGFSKDQVIPLALHVDYWDYIGWKDQFSQASFSKRQTEYRKRKRSSSVYTPQIIFNGEDVRRVRFENQINSLQKERAVVDFGATAVLNDDLLQVTIDIQRMDKLAINSRLKLVIAENNLVAHVKTGENTGRTLHHEHVVRSWLDAGDIVKAGDKTIMKLPVKETWKQQDLELIVFVESMDMQILQAMRLPLSKH